jgi:putrescine importer
MKPQTHDRGKYMPNAAPVTLKRSLRLWNLIIIGMVIVQPTAPMGIYGVISNKAHGHVVTTILIAMIAMLFTAISYGRMARVYPSAGSAYTYVGQEMHSALGYIVGWGMVMDYILNPLICTIWCSKAAMNFVPGIPYVAWVLLFALIFTGLNLRGVETSARINAAVAAGLGVVIVLFVVAAIRYLIHTAIGSPAFFLDPLYNKATFSAPAVYRGTSIAVLTYIGFDGISTLSDEAHDPKRTIPRAIILTCLITGILASIEVYLAQLVWPRGMAFPDLDTAYVAVAQRVGGVFLFAVMNGALLIATIGSGMASQLGAARLLFAMGQDGALPRNFFGALNPVRRIPQNNVLLIGAIVLVGSLAMSYQLGTELLNYGALLAFMGVNLSSAVLAWRSREPGFWVAIVFSLFGFIVCLFLWRNLGPTALKAGTIWAALGILLWLVRRKQISSPFTEKLQ